MAKQAKEPRFADCDPESFLYIDTETTGLGGAGVMVFLAGTAKFDGKCFVQRDCPVRVAHFVAALIHPGGGAATVARG